MTGDLSVANWSVPTFIDVAKRYNSAFWLKSEPCFQGVLLIKHGEIARGVAQLGVAYEEATRRTALSQHFWGFMGDFAEGLVTLSRRAEAMAAIDETLSRFERDGLRWSMAELLRVKGEMLIQDPSRQSISIGETHLSEALAMSREQGALFWELRAAMSLARYRLTQDRRREAAQILAPVYDRFTEGFDTADLLSARFILDALRRSH